MIKILHLLKMFVHVWRKNIFSLLKIFVHVWRKNIFSLLKIFFPQTWTNIFSSSKMQNFFHFSLNKKFENWTFPIKNGLKHFTFSKFYFFRKILIAYSVKKPHKWKKHSVSIFVLTTVFEKMCPHLIWDFLSYLG